MTKKDFNKYNAPVFPFTAIVGQEEMKLALQLNVIDPKIGGVMIMGDRGTGKSTTIRALADLLPEMEVVKGDPFNSHKSNYDLMSNEIKSAIKNNQVIETEFIKIPMVDLPLGATEDRVCGTIDIEKALTEGIKAFEPGLLAKANRGILYVDEVNGELRPQLLDRFGMHAEIRTVKDPKLRVKVVEERTSFDQDPDIWIKNYEQQQQELRNKIIAAQKTLPFVVINDDLRLKISEVCSQLDVDGLRGDIVTNRAAKAYTAYDGRTDVTIDDISKVITLCLRHRLRKDPLESIDSGEKVSKIFKEVFEIEN
jgi:magnesium chelatase subunit I